MGTQEGRKIQLKDRVKRVGSEGPGGVVTDIRHEVTAGSNDAKAGLLINVLWDNGTQSYFAPEGLTVIEPAKDR